jgi:hypothetical protein
MTAKKPSVADAIKDLVRGTKPAPIKNRKIDTVKETKEPKKEDGRKHNKGHPGSGRKPGGSALLRREIRALVQQHYNEEVTVKVKDPKTGVEREIKKPRVLIAIDALFTLGMKNNDANAIDRYLNRALGKPPQPLVGDEEEDPIQINHDVTPILEKAYGDDDED